MTWGTRSQRRPGDTGCLMLVREQQGAREGVTCNAPRQVTALIGPSGCGKSTYLRTQPDARARASARLSGQVLLDGEDIYGQGVRVTETRLRIGMVFQSPTPSLR